MADGLLMRNHLRGFGNWSGANVGGGGVEIKYIRTKLKIRASVYQKGLLVAPSVGDWRSGRCGKSLMVGE